MQRSLILLAIACTVAAACSGAPSGPAAPTPKAARLSRTRFLAFGDSFTAGEVTTPVASSSGLHKLILMPLASYPAQLQAQLRTAYSQQEGSIAVANSGEPGERILDGSYRFPGVFDASRPEVVLLMEGANDLPLVGPDTSSDLMRSMVQTATQGGARVFVGSMIPQVNGRPRATTPTFELLNYNTKLQVMATQEGLTFVDLYNPMLPEAASLIGIDGLHPTEAGYRRIAELFFAAIKRELEQ